VLHVSDINTCKVRRSERSNRQDMQVSGTFVRGLCRNGYRCWRSRLCSVAACQRVCPNFVDSRPDVTPGNRTPASSGPWPWTVHPVAGHRAARRCADRSGRRSAVQGTWRSSGRNLGQSARTELYCNETTGAAGRGHGGSLLVGEVWGNSRSQRRAGPLARGITAVCAQPRRCEGPRRSALAGGSVPVPRQTARHLGGAP
jgi:hypothetical protein